MASVFRDRLLDGKVAFVTGGSSGIGLAMAERFAEAGARVMLLARNPEKLDAARRGIEVRGGVASSAVADVRDYGAIAAALEQTRRDFGPIDIVLAGAAGNFLAPALGMSANGFKAVVDIDLLGTFNTIRAAYEHLRRPGASILAISAAHANLPIAFQSHVCAAKAGVELLIRTLALEWGPDGVRCNCITPGLTADTEGMRRLVPDQEIEEKVTATIPLGRLGRKEELAELALFLCTEAAAYITGATFACDGGQSLGRSGLSVAAAWAKQLPA